MTKLEHKFCIGEEVYFSIGFEDQVLGTIVGVQGSLQPTEKISVLYLISIRGEAGTSEHIIPEGEVVSAKEECQV